MTLPPLPTLRQLTRELKALHEAWSHPAAGGEHVRLCISSDFVEPPGWRLYTESQIESAGLLRPRGVREIADTCGVFGHEYVPGTQACGQCDGGAEPTELGPFGGTAGCARCDGAGHVPTPFDATAAARRLLAAARDGMLAVRTTPTQDEE